MSQALPHLALLDDDLVISDINKAQRMMENNREALLSDHPLKIESPMGTLKRKIESLTNMLSQAQAEINTIDKVISDTQSEREGLQNSPSSYQRDDSRRSKGFSTGKVAPPKINTGDAVAMQLLLKKEFELRKRMSEMEDQKLKFDRQLAVLSHQLKQSEEVAQLTVVRQLKDFIALKNYFDECQQSLNASLGQLPAYMIGNADNELIQLTSTHITTYQKLHNHYALLEKHHREKFNDYVQYVQHQYLICCRVMSQDELYAHWNDTFLKLLQLDRIRPPLTSDELTILKQSFETLQNGLKQHIKV